MDAASQSTPAELAARFRALADGWQRATLVSSDMAEIMMHPDYQRIVGMGPAALPLILEDLAREGHQWFWALVAIAGEDPAADTETFEEARRIWLEWGRTRGRAPEFRPKTSAELAARFRALADGWKNDTMYSSMVRDTIMHQDYQMIIGMGPAALPLIFEDLATGGGNWWYWALAAITGENPAEGADTFAGAREVWLGWGEAHGFRPGARPEQAL